MLVTPVTTPVGVLVMVSKTPVKGSKREGVCLFGGRGWLETSWEVGGLRVTSPLGLGSGTVKGEESRLVSGDWRNLGEGRVA